MDTGSTRGAAHDPRKDHGMGDVISFTPRAKNPNVCVQPTAHAATRAHCGLENALLAARREGQDRHDILAAAAPLIEHCRDHGFTVMRDGLPSEPDELADALLTLRRGLAALETEFGGQPLWSFGVYFGYQKLTWFEDGSGGKNALAVPSNVAPAEFAAFVRPRVKALRR
jgi:hypothetical protein